MKNISNIKDCYGCGVCSIACSRKIIDIRLNEDGFYFPIITDNERCTDCGMCLAICAYNNDGVIHKNKLSNVEGYACWSKDEETRYTTTSGGACYEICKMAIEKGYKIIGVEYDLEKHIAQHYVATTIDELEKSKRSKYIPSYTLTGFSQINRRDKYCIIGTPCHIDSLRRYIQKQKIEQNFILIDFFCHGVSSLSLWKKYLQLAEKKAGKIVRISFRNKSQEWDDSWVNIYRPENYKKLDWHSSLRVKIWGEKNNFRYSPKRWNDFFYFFLNNRCLNKVCYDRCHYKLLSSSADIRVGDFWGKDYLHDNLGVNSMLGITEKGRSLILETKNLVLHCHTLDKVIEAQMKSAPICPKSYNYINKALKNNGKLMKISFIADILDGNFYLIHLWHRIFQKIKSKITN